MSKADPPTTENESPAFTARLRRWIIDHDESWLFFAPYIILAVVLSAVISLFWLMGMQWTPPGDTIGDKVLGSHSPSWGGAVIIPAAHHLCAFGGHAMRSARESARPPRVCGGFLFGSRGKKRPVTQIGGLYRCSQLTLSGCQLAPDVAGGDELIICNFDFPVPGGVNTKFDPPHTISVIKLPESLRD